MKDEKGRNGKTKEAEAQVPGASHPELGGSALRPAGDDARKTANGTPARKNRQEGNRAPAPVPSGGRKARKSNPRQGSFPKPRLANPLSLFLSIVSGALTAVGLGFKGAFQFLVRGVLRVGRGFLGLLGLLVQGVAEVGKGILKLLSLLVRSVVAVGKGILTLLSMVVRSVVAVGKGILALISMVVRGITNGVRRVLRLLQLMVGAVVQAGKRVLAMFKLLAQGVVRAGKQAVRLLEWMATPFLWVLVVLVRSSIRVGRRVHEILELSVEAVRRLLPTRQVAPEAIGLITSEGGPQVANILSAEATILITSGLDQGRSFQVGEEPVTIGSGENCGIRLPAVPGFAAEHARLWWRDGQRMLHHLAPDQATIVAGKQIIWTSLQDGDEASIGPYSLRITAGKVDIPS